MSELSDLDSSSSSSYINIKEEEETRKEKEIVSDFISSLFNEEETEEEEKLAVSNFIGSLFEEEKPKKKIFKGIYKPKAQTIKNSNQNTKKNILSSKNNDPKNNKAKNNTYISKNKTIENEPKNSRVNKIFKTNYNKNENINQNQKNKIIRKKTPDNIDKNFVFYKVDKNERRNNSVQKRNIRKLNENKGINLNKTYDTYRPEMSEKLRAKLESEKEKKECEEKIRIMRNHISAMKRQQEDMNKKIIFLKNKEKNINKAKKQKENTKKAIYEYNINRRIELERKRKNIEKQREIMNKGVKESSEKAKIDKAKKYKEYIKEREEENKINEKKQINSIHNQIIKIKAIRENNKNIGTNRRKNLNQNYLDSNEKKYETNIEKTKLLKEEINRLQTEEDALLEKLNKTKDRYNTLTSNDKYISIGYNKNGKNTHNNY